MIVKTSNTLELMNQIVLKLFSEYKEKNLENFKEINLIEVSRTEESIQYDLFIRPNKCAEYITIDIII